MGQGFGIFTVMKLHMLLGYFAFESLEVDEQCSAIFVHLCVFYLQMHANCQGRTRFCAGILECHPLSTCTDDNWNMLVKLELESHYRPFISKTIYLYVGCTGGQNGNSYGP